MMGSIMQVNYTHIDTVSIIPLPCMQCVITPPSGTALMCVPANFLECTLACGAYIYATPSHEMVLLAAAIIKRGF
jgi:hypothetical protein